HRSVGERITLHLCEGEHAGGGAEGLRSRDRHGITQGKTLHQVVVESPTRAGANDCEHAKDIGVEAARHTAQQRCSGNHERSCQPTWTTEMVAEEENAEDGRKRRLQIEKK